jgi:hypothetical protein
MHLRLVGDTQVVCEGDWQRGVCCWAIKYSMFYTLSLYHPVSESAVRAKSYLKPRDGESQWHADLDRVSPRLFVTLAICSSIPVGCACLCVFLCVLPPSIISWLICLIAREIVCFHTLVFPRDLYIATAVLYATFPGLGLSSSLTFSLLF